MPRLTTLTWEWMRGGGGGGRLQEGKLTIFGLSSLSLLVLCFDVFCLFFGGAGSSSLMSGEGGIGFVAARFGRGGIDITFFEKSKINDYIFDANESEMDAKISVPNKPRAVPTPTALAPAFLKRTNES